MRDEDERVTHVLMQPRRPGLKLELIASQNIMNAWKLDRPYVHIFIPNTHRLAELIVSDRINEI